MEGVLNYENIYPYQGRVQGAHPLIFAPIWGPKERPAPPPPLSQSLDDPALTPYLKVWIHHCLPCSYFVPFRPWYRALLFLLTHSSWKVRQNTQSCVQRLFNSLGESAVELQSSLLTEFSKLLSTQKVSKAWIFLHFSFPFSFITSLLY